MDPTNSLLSTQERMETIQNLFSDLIPFVEILQNDVEINIDCLTKLEELQKRANKQHLAHEDISDYEGKIANHLSEAFQSSLKSQLSSYWNCWGQIVNSGNFKYVNIRNTTNDYILHMQEIDFIYQELYDNDPQESNIALYATFYIHILKVEKIEYALQHDLLEYSDYIQNYDIEDMFSFRGKIRCSKTKSGYVTHGRAIRDALAHKKFKISEHDGQKHIIFDNKDFGYNFQEQLTIEEFLVFIHGSDKLYKIMYTMQSLMLLSTLLHESLDSTDL